MPRTYSSPSRPRPHRMSQPARAEQTPLQGTRQHYERAMKLGDAEALAGHRVEAERYYQLAEHYLRSGNGRAA
ncbi:DUF4167 domain-containing protein [Bosea sp. BIWAKO-01]|uniref:DUF4167 domain-containing protein n=1 Tax=Bosea sp. BIWAKO-01 TaxID=506668 RepID=UPI00114CD5B6|nr:DUF4167 domain-containing protein [Bosea sp. BIWAKO-01]